MTALREPEVRGACPGALEPMESGDGLIVRVRPHGGSLSVAALAALADAAQTLGNGAIDLTRRANLQLRGLTPETLAPLRDIMAGLGLLDETAAAERRRNIMVSPLAGLDAAAPGFANAQALARDLEQALAGAPELSRLSAKFGFLIDDGGAHLSLASDASDIRLRFVSETSAAVGLDMKGGTHWVGSVPAHDAAETAVKAAAHVLALTQGTKARRLRDCPLETADKIAAALALTAIAPPAAPALAPRLGIISHDGTPLAVALAAPFGRIEAVDLADFAATLRDLGIAKVRLSPWRALVVPANAPELAGHILAAGLAHGFLANDADPLTHIDACTGAPACPCGGADTRLAARRLAALWPGLGLTTAHVSGCAKGCARTNAADLVLVGRGDHFDVLRHARADAPATSTIPLTLDGLAAALHAKEG